MRKSLWIMLAVLVVAIGAPIAHADSFTATFTCNGSCTIPLALINNPVAFPSPTLDFGGDTSNVLTLPASMLPTDTYTWTDSLTTGNEGGTKITFGALTITDVTQKTSAQVTLFDIGNGTTIFGEDQGSLTFTAVAAPEPSSVALMLLGVGILFVMWNRMGHSRQSAA